MKLSQRFPALARDARGTATDSEAMVATRTHSLYTAQGAGALSAAFLAAYASTLDKNKMLLLRQVVFILPLIGLRFRPNVQAAVSLLVLIGWGMVTQLVMMNTLIQIRVPDDLRGRVCSVDFWALQGVVPFVNIVTGWIAQDLGSAERGQRGLLGIAGVRFGCARIEKCPA